MRTRATYARFTGLDSTSIFVPVTAGPKTVEGVADDLADFADRRGRTIEDELATYRPTAGG